MKKTYMIPEALTVVLGTCKMMAASDPDVTIGNDDETIGAGGVQTKGISDVNLWDEEW
jgi:hypothetical protein